MKVLRAREAFFSGSTLLCVDRQTDPGGDSPGWSDAGRAAGFSSCSFTVSDSYFSHADVFRDKVIKKIISVCTIETPLLHKEMTFIFDVGKPRGGANGGKENDGRRGSRHRDDETQSAPVRGRQTDRRLPRQGCVRPPFRGAEEKMRGDERGGAVG